MASRADQHRDLLRIGIDLGTGYTQLDAQHIHGTATIFDAPIKPICLQGPDPRIEQIAILLENGDVIYGGPAVYKALFEKPALRDRVLELWKLAPHPKFKHFGEVIHVRDILSAEKDRGAIQDFMADQLKQIIRDIRAHFKNTSSAAGKDAAYWDNISIELQISVPAMWGDYEMGVVRNAAREAIGTDPYSKIQLREEALCVATVYMSDLIANKSIKEGESLVLVDCGKGTLDIATIRLVRMPSGNNLLQLQRVGNSLGDDSGSHFVNTKAWEWIVSGQCVDVRNLSACCEQLGISKYDFQRQFSKGMDQIKDEIDVTPGDLPVKIKSSHGESGQGRRPHLWFDVPRNLLNSWYKMWTDRAARLVKQHLDEHSNVQYSCAALTGGGSRSETFRTAMKAVLGKAPYNITVGNNEPHLSMCSRGALQQHFFQEDSHPAVSNYYLGMTEEYNRSLHKGAKSAGLIKISEYDSSKKIVHDRVKKIMTHRKDTSSKSEMQPVFFLVEADTLVRLDFNLYRSENDVKDHSHLYEDDFQGDEKTLRPGIREYPLVFKDIADLSTYVFRVTNTRDAKSVRHFELRTFVELNCNNDRLQVNIYGMRHDYRYPSEGGQQFDPAMVIFTHTQEPWNKSCSHFVRDNTGTPQDNGTSHNTHNTRSKRKNDAPHALARKHATHGSRNPDLDYFGYPKK